MEQQQASSIQLATFAGGCFWCMVKPFDQLPGILKVVSGYSGGHTENPTYKDIKTQTTGHYEVVQITFDSTQFSYEQLLELYWPQIDPTDAEGQFQDRGPSYRAAIFYHSEAQREQAEASKAVIAASGRFDKPIVTEILPAKTFYPAEDYHQDYYKKSPDHYREDRLLSGRDSFIDQHWNSTTNS